MLQKTQSSLKPIQLIKFDQRKNIQLTQQAIDIFNKLQSEQLCIVCVAGKYRTGKSYILNRVLLQQNHGFEVGPTINACTKGLWMWPQVVKINFCGHQKQCIVIDTEGLGSLQEGQNTDIKIFLMATLLSSYLIYNSVGSIDQKALESLNLVINMATLLQKQADRFDSQQLINSFPSFMWLVRDFSLKLQDQNGEEINSEQYLQNALKLTKAKTPAGDRKNQIRIQLKKFFQQRDCYTLIRPTLNQRDLQNLSTLSEKKLRPEFVELIKGLKKRIHYGIQPKKIRGKSITPQGFIQLCNYYVKNINSGKLPSINSHWDNLCMNESGRLIKSKQIYLYFQEYQLILKEKILSLKQNDREEKINEYYEKLLKQGYNLIDKSFLGKLEKKLTKEKLEKTLNQQINMVFFEKNNKIEEQIQQEVRKIIINFTNNIENCEEQDYQQKIDKQSQHIFANFKHIFCKFLELSKQYSSKGMNKQKINSQTKIYLNNLTKIYEVFINQVQQKILPSLQQSYSKIQEKAKDLQAKIKNIDERYLHQVSSLRKDHILLKEELFQKQRSQMQLQVKCQNLQTKFNSFDQEYKKMKVQISEISNQKQHQRQEFESKLKQLSNYSNQQIQQKIKLLKDELQQKQLNLTFLTNQLKQSIIKQRKLVRQSQIYKQKIIQKQKQNDQLTKQIELLKLDIAKVESDKRKLIRLNNSNNSTLNLSLSTMNLKQLIQTEEKLQKFNSNNYDNQFEEREQFLKQINQKQLYNRNLVQENKNLTKMLNEQRQLNQLLINTPQNISYNSLKKNYQIQKENSHRLSSKLKDYQNFLTYTNRVQCSLCGQLIQKQKMINSKHYINCMNSKNKQIEFDVSYVYGNDDGELKFLFQITVEENSQSSNDDPLARIGFSSTNQKVKKTQKWQVTKSLKSIRLFLTKIGRSEAQINLFRSKKQKISENLSEKIEKNNQNDNQINLNQERRLLLDEICLELKFQIWKNTFLIEFFAFDINVLFDIKSNLSKKNSQKKKQEEVLSFKRKKKLLNLNLGQILEQIQPLNNENDKNWASKTMNFSSGSLNSLKTSKFTQKKTFKFGPHV